MRYPKITRKTNKNKQLCPLCGKILKCQDDSFQPVYWCPKAIKFQGGKQKFHYICDTGTNTIEMIVMPYRITSCANSTKISIHIPPDHPNATASYKSGKWLFKSVCTVQSRIPPMDPEKLLNKIKMIVLFS